MTTPFNPTYCLSNALNVVTVDPVNESEPSYVTTLRIEDIGASPVKTIAILKQTPNAANKVIFDLSEVLRVTSPTLVDHGIDFQFSTESVKRLRLTTTEVWDGGTNQIATAEGYVIHGAQQFNEGLLYDNVGTNDTFLVHLKNIKATPDDIGVVGVQLPSSGGVQEAVIKVYDSANDLLDTFEVPLGLVSANPTTRVQFIALYPVNLEAIQLLPSNWSYYTAQVDTDILRVDRACDLPYKKHRLAFVNNKGGWEYFNFDLNYSETIEIERQEFTRLFGTWNAATFGYSFQERGRAVFDATQIERLTISAKVTSEQSRALKFLLASREVQLINEDNTVEPVIVTDTSFPIFHDMDRSAKTLTVRIEKAHNIKVA